MTAELKLGLPETSAAGQAARWLARQRVSALSEAEAAEFAAWLKADATHTAAWSEFERLWGQVEAVRDDPKILAVREEARDRAAWRMSTGVGNRAAVALAASLVLGVAVWWGLQKAVLAPGDGPTRAQALEFPSASTRLIRDASTEIGERSLLVLADGSKVTLNTASSVRADYTGRERRLTLVRGEAFFDVAKDPTRPFVVTAGTRQIIAVGTAFNVRLQDRQIKVTLVEGKVRVVRTAMSASVSATEVPAAPAVALEAGSALVAEADGADHVERLDTTRATSWRSGKLVFDGERLADVVAEMNRYSRQQLEIADSTLENRKVSGVFEPTEAQAFAQALETYGIARARQQTTTTIVLDVP